MSDLVEIPWEIVSEPSGSQSRWLGVVVAFVFIVAVRVLPFPFMRTELQRGKEVSIVEYWPHVMSFAWGEDPTWRMERHSDGSILEGPLLDGRKHGEWERRVGGSVTRFRQGGNQ